MKTDPRHFAKAVTELGEKCQVLTAQAIAAIRWQYHQPAVTRSLLGELVTSLLSSDAPASELHSKAVAVMADPVGCLLEVDATLSAVAEPSAQLRRPLANVDVEPQQLKQLGGDALDEFFQLELTLLAQEAAWQLHTLARRAKRRWPVEPDGTNPDKLQVWPDRVDALAANINSMTPAQLRGSE